MGLKLIRSMLLMLFILALPLTGATPTPCLDKDGREIPCGYREGDFPVSGTGAISFGLGFLGVFFFMISLGILGAVFWIWMLVDCIRRDFKDKALWILIILLGSILGAIIYYFVVRGKNKEGKGGKFRKTKRLRRRSKIAK